MAKSLEAELVVKPQDGRIADKNSYGNHPAELPGWQSPGLLARA